MEKILTAEEFLDLQHEVTLSCDFDIRKVMIEFAKLHVERALKEASKKGKVTECIEGYFEISKTSILNSYPLDNIK